MPPIKFYGLSTCIHCRKAKEYLDGCGAQYDLTYVDQLTGKEREDCIANIKKINPGLSFPTIVVGDRVVVGFKQDELEKALNEAK